MERGFAAPGPAAAPGAAAAPAATPSTTSTTHWYADDMVRILRAKMERDYVQGRTLRDAHPKTLGLVRGVFKVERDLPPELARGVFKEPGRAYDCLVRFSNASGSVQPDDVPDLRGVGIKLLAPKQSKTDPDKPLGQDFVLLSYRSMPLGTPDLFHAAVKATAEYNMPILLA